jgi:hypothetical protein
LLLALILLQSLGEAARKEAERRKALEEQGISGKVIEAHDPARMASQGNISLSSPPPASARPRAADRPTGKSNERVRNAILKLDREIRQAEDRLASLRRQAQAERWAPPRAGKVVRRGGAVQNEERIREEISELELKLKRLREQRLETYDGARKSGMLPGEIDGKGIIP